MASPNTTSGDLWWRNMRHMNGAPYQRVSPTVWPRLLLPMLTFVLPTISCNYANFCSTNYFCNGSNYDFNGTYWLWFYLVHTSQSIPTFHCRCWCRLFNLLRFKYCVDGIDAYACDFCLVVRNTSSWIHTIFFYLFVSFTLRRQPLLSSHTFSYRSRTLLLNVLT